MHWREAQETWLLALKAEGWSHATLDGYRGHLAHFNRFLETEGISDIAELTPFHLRRFLVQYSEGRSPWRAFYRRLGDIMVIGAIGPDAQQDEAGFRRAVAAAERRIADIEREQGGT